MNGPQLTPDQLEEVRARNRDIKSRIDLALERLEDAAVPGVQVAVNTNGPHIRIDLAPGPIGNVLLLEMMAEYAERRRWGD